METLRPPSFALRRDDSEPKILLSPGEVCRLAGTSRTISRTVRNRRPRGHHCPAIRGPRAEL